MNDMSAKDVYEFSKLTSSHRQIMDDFTQTVVMTMFRDYLAALASPEVALDSYMDMWSKNIINQKEDEIAVLSNEHESMSDMVAGMSIVGAEDVEQFKEDVMGFKDMVSEHITASLEELKGE